MKNDDAWAEAQRTKGFERNFRACRNQKIALYGIGKNAERALSYGRVFDIVAVAARDHIGEDFHGHVICRLPDAVAASDLMIIAATPQATREVFDRIGTKVPAGYPVYNLFGRKLVRRDAPERFAHASLADLKAAIDAHDVISFDIFDTLVMRKTLQPRDVFALEERELREQGEAVPFAAWRMAAEADQVAAGHLPDFAGIYRYLQKEHALPAETVRRWKEREWELEENLIVPRRDVVSALRYAKAQGKTVCLTSDMYFSKAELERLLADKGVAGYDVVLVSCDVQATKAEGTLFRYLIDLADGRSILHIGDHAASDDAVPRQLGIDTFPIQKASDMLAASAGRDVLNHAETLEDHLLLGMILAEVCNSPFAAFTGSDGRIALSSLRDLVWLCLLPVTMRYLQFLVQTVHGEENAVLLFLSRDGYFLQKAYAALAERHHLPDSIYFYASRQAANGVMVEDEDDIDLFLQTLLERKEQNLKFQLEYFFQVPFGAEFDLPIKEALSQWGRDGIARRVKQEGARIFQAQAERRKAYRAYLRSLHLERYAKAYCVDIVTKGTVFRCLRKLLPQPVGLLAMGGLPALHDFVPDAEDAHLMYGIVTQYSVFAPWFPVLELPYASQDGQLKEFTQDGEPVFLEGTEYRADFLEAAQEALAQGMLSMTDDDWYKHPLSDALCASMLELLGKEFSVIAEDVLDAFRTGDPEQFHQMFNLLRFRRGEAMSCES